MPLDLDWDVTCKVYMGNKDNYVKKRDIADAFSVYGPLRKIWVSRNRTGFAFVEYYYLRDAENAVRGLDGMSISGEYIRVEMANGRRRVVSDSDDDSCKVFVDLKESYASRYDIEVAFSEYGPIKDICVERQSTGIAFVEYYYLRHAENAVRGLDGKWLCGERIRVEMATGNRRVVSDWDDDSCKVVVDLKESYASRYDIEEAFSEYGPIKGIWVERQSTGNAFVEYYYLRDAENAVRGLDGEYLCGDIINVEMGTGKRRGYGAGGEGCGGGRGRRRTRSPPPRERRHRSRSPKRSRRYR